MRNRLGTLLFVAAVALVLGACSPSKEEPSDLPPGTEITPSQQANAAANPSAPSEGEHTVQPGEQGPECVADDIEVTGGFGQRPEVTIPDDCAAPRALLSKDLTEGNGPQAAEGSTVEVRYQLVTWSDKQVKDGNFGAAEPLPVHELGEANVIQGWNEGLVGIEQGTRRLLVVPPDQGYGRGGTDHIAPNETLVFVIDAVSVEKHPG